MLPLLHSPVVVIERLSSSSSGVSSARNSSYCIAIRFDEGLVLPVLYPSPVSVEVLVRATKGASKIWTSRVLPTPLAGTSMT